MNFIEEKILSKGNLEKLKFRFPPEPNGSKTIVIDESGNESIKYDSGLHLGHAKSICLNFGLAKKYNVPCILRFDDTNPRSEESEYINSMIRDIEWLGFSLNEISYTSDYFDFIYSCVVSLMLNGKAYIDDLTSEEIANMKGTTTSPGTNSPFRDRSLEENLDLLNRMKLGEFPERSKVVRAKIDMSDPNMIMRDPILYRIIDVDHFRTGNAWKIYPMYDFAHPLCDYYEKITDSLCTLEFEIHRPLYMWVLEHCNLGGNFPEETEFARLNVDYSVMSKRKIKNLIDNGFISGWDDPRLLTISGLRKRGYTPESIKNFCERIGVTKRESLISHLLLEESLREDLNKKSKRIMGVMDPIKLTISNWKSGVEWVEIDTNPEDTSMGTRFVPFSNEVYIEREDFRKEANSKYHRLKIGGEVRLKGSYIIKAVDCVEENGEVIEVICEYDPTTISEPRKVKGTIHWVSCDHSIERDVYEYDVLFDHPNPDGGGRNYMDHINKESIFRKSGKFDVGILDLNIGETVQMMRKGYYVLDTDGESFNKSVSLKESFPKG